MKHLSKVGMLEYSKGIQPPEQLMLIIKQTLIIRGPVRVKMALVVRDDGFNNWYIFIRSLTIGATSYLKLICY